MRKSWPTVSNSPGALCWISSSVAGLIPGERTSATPRSVLQISDRHLRRYPIHIAFETKSNGFELGKMEVGSEMVIASSEFSPSTGNFFPALPRTKNAMLLPKP